MSPNRRVMITPQNAHIGKPKRIPKGMRWCCTCREVKSTDHFSRSKNLPGGYCLQCRNCLKYGRDKRRLKEVEAANKERNGD